MGWEGGGECVRRSLAGSRKEGSSAWVRCKRNNFGSFGQHHVHCPPTRTVNVSLKMRNSKWRTSVHCRDVVWRLDDAVLDLD
jgi:hypothetical protein